MGRLRQAMSGVAERARRRPVRSAALSAGAAGVAAVVAIPLAIGGSNGAPSAPGSAVRSAVTGTSRGIGPWKTGPWPWSGLRMNGRPPADADGTAAEPWFDVVPGQKLTFTVTVTVPAHTEMTKLFLGITANGTVTGIGPRGPIGMVPVLATASHLTAGRHRFTLHWTVPRHTTGVNAGYEVAGAEYWPRGTAGEPGAAEGGMANVFVEPAGN
jgi:hypothetical protein